MTNDYTPALQAVSNSNSREELIRCYWRQGLQYSEILAILDTVHGITISLRTLKRDLIKLQLSRRIESDHQQIVSALITEIHRGGGSRGYRRLWQILRLQYGLTVHRDTVMLLLRQLDPRGSAFRHRRRLQRRVYCSLGPDFIYHIDGYDKLKPFGFAIHGAIDGNGGYIYFSYSRRIMWLEVSSTNNDPQAIAYYFCCTIEQRQGIPLTVRADRGSETGYVKLIQDQLRSITHSRRPAFLYGKSTSNQRIEAWWSYLARDTARNWIALFSQLRHDGIFDDSNNMDKQLLRYAFMGPLRDELYNVAAHWNLHRIRSSNAHSGPFGRPDVNYFAPSRNGRRSFLCDFKYSEFVTLRQQYASQPADLDIRCYRLFELIRGSLNLAMPQTKEDAVTFYCRLQTSIQTI